MSETIGGAFSSPQGTQTASTTKQGGGFIGPPTAGESGMANLASYGSTGAGVLSTVMQGASQISAARYQEAIARRNAELARQNAEFAALAREQNVELADEETERQISTATSQFSKSGVVTTAGSPLLAISEQAIEGATARERIRTVGNIEEFNYRTQAVMADFEASKAKKAARSAMINTGLSVGMEVGGSLLK